MTNIIYRYLPEKGPRAPFVVGVPARDIAEWELFADPGMEAIIVANMATSGAIYAIAAAKSTKTAKVATETATPAEDVAG
jgi:hypothetical protein